MLRLDKLWMCTCQRMQSLFLEIVQQRDLSWSIFFQKNENVQIDPTNILITNGVQEAISLAISCFKDKTLACIEPSYPGFEDAAKAKQLILEAIDRAKK